VDSALNSLLPANNAPTAAADTASVTEAGGVRVNATASTTATGNVLTNDQDDVGDTKQVTKVGTNTAGATVSSGSTSTSSATTVTGTYGNLVIGADGSYSYSIRSASNTLAAMEALRTSNNTLTDTFTYTMADGSGVTSTTTLTVTIQGNNDNPTANPDVNTAKESLLANGNAAQYTATDPLGARATGNVLSNDADVDLNGEGATVTGIGATTNGTTPQTVTVSTIPLNSVTGIIARTASNARGDAVFTLVNGVWTDTTYRVFDIDATANTLRIYNGTQNPSIPADLSTLTISSGQDLRFYATSSNGTASSPLTSEAIAQVNLAAGTSASTSVLVDSVV
jgi:VCBS repeat-containing protein